MKTSRYRWARLFASHFEFAHFRSIQHADVLFAAADDASISALMLRAGSMLDDRQIVRLPTSFDPEYFRPIPSCDTRRTLSIDLKSIVWVVPGRISRIKGWDLLLESFERFKAHTEDAILIFVGDGEDRPLLEDTIRNRHLDECVRITGFLSQADVAQYINAADAVLLASSSEGWPTVVVEALACGKKVVATRVSAISELIRNGHNGFIVENRNPDDFAKALNAVIDLPDAVETSTAIASQYTLSAYAHRLATYWPPLQSRAAA